MATFSKRSGAWRARIIRRPLGIDESATFPTKLQAQAWATKREAEILAGQRGLPIAKSVGDAIDDFIEKECGKRRGGRWDSIRLAVFKKHKLAFRPIGKVTSDDIARWRDERLTQVSPSSVAREMNLWAALFSVAVREWKWISVNPCRGAGAEYRAKVIAFAVLRVFRVLSIGQQFPQRLLQPLDSPVLRVEGVGGFLQVGRSG